MSRAKGVRARLRALLRSRQAEARMDEEFAFHIEMETQRRVRDGYAPAEARRLALVAFGGVDAHRESMREGRRTRALPELLQDVRFAARSLRRAPGFAAVAGFVIALGVGATTALFSVTNALLLRPLPVASPAELHQVQEIRWGAVSIGAEGRRIPYVRYESYRAATQDVFDDVAAYAMQSMSMRTPDGAAPIHGAVTSPNYFAVLGLRPAAGRFYDADESPLVVVSHRFAAARLGGAAAAVGEALYLNGRIYTIAGVAPRGFGGVLNGIGLDVWVPFRAWGSADPSEMSRWVGMFARLRAGVPAARASAAVNTVAKRIAPDEQHTTIERAYIAPLTGLPENSRGDVVSFMTLLLIASLLVLLIAASNIAGLLLTRGVARRREIAVRLALGAGRWRLIRLLLTESLVLFLAGAAGGIAIAELATTLMSRISIPGVPLLLDFSLDVRVLGFALSVAAVTGLVFGLAPAVRAARADLVPALKGVNDSGRPRTRLRSAFVASQLALAVVLLVAAGLIVRGLQRGLTTDPGLDVNGVYIGALDLEPHGYDETTGRAFFDELRRRVTAMPDVETAAFASTVLIAGNRKSNDVSSVGDAPINTTSAQNVVDAAYFEALRIPLRAGRGFTAADRVGAERVVIVNETLARTLWPGASPIGQRLRRGGIEFEVIGVVSDSKYVSMTDEPMPFAFYAAAQEHAPRMVLHVRARNGGTDLLPRLRRELRTLDPDVALEEAMSYRAQVAFAFLPQRFAAVLIGLFGVLGVTLAAAGVYGVMAYQVAQRMREFGIRIALGAAAPDVMRLVLHNGLSIGIGGAVAGLVLAAGVSRLLRAMLFGLSPLDPLTFLSVGVGLVAVTLLASSVPARRALRADPMSSLRAE